MVNIFMIKVTNPQGSSVTNIGGTINVLFTTFNKINMLAESHGDWSVTPSCGVISDPDFQDTAYAPGMLGVI